MKIGEKMEKNLYNRKNLPETSPVREGGGEGEAVPSPEEKRGEKRRPPRKASVRLLLPHPVKKRSRGCELFHFP